MVQLNGTIINANEILHFWWNLLNFRFLGCALPTRFRLKDNSGDYWCLSDDNHFHTNSHCPSDYESTKKHEFVLVTNADNNEVPSGKCAIKFGYDNSFFKYQGKVEGDSTFFNGDGRYLFVVTSVGNGKVNILSVSENKYLKVDGHHAKARESSDCGNDCQFTVEEVVTTVYEPPESSGTLTNGVLHRYSFL